MKYLGTDVRFDQIGMVFCVLGRDMRQCLICGDVFTPQAAAIHANTACFLSQKLFNRVGETKDGNR